MKVWLTALVLACLIPAAASSSFAAGGCPQSAGSLQEFGHCLAPVPGTVSMVYTGTLANLDPAHQQLMASMQRGPVVPPQAVVPYPMYGSPYYNPVAGAIVRASAFVAAAKSGNPYYYFMLGMPLF